MRWRDFMKSETYDLHCEFDIEKHKATYVNYLEVVITEDGVVHYAIPSHQEYLIHYCMNLYDWTREQVYYAVPKEYYFDVVVWLCKMTNCVSVWNNYLQYYHINPAQMHTLKQLYDAGLYYGKLPK